MTDFRIELHRAADFVADYREGLPAARVGSSATRDDVRRALAPELPDGPVRVDAVIDELVTAAEPGLTASAARATSAS